MSSDDDKESFIERRIVTGMVLSTDYLRIIQPFLKTELLESAMPRLLAEWCMEYFKKYNRAPGKDIEGIYTAKLRDGLDKDHAEAIELLLESLSDEYSRTKFNVDYLLDQTRKYLSERHLQKHVDSIRAELQSGSLTEAEKLASGFATITKESPNVEDPFTPEAIMDIFSAGEESLIHFGKALGELWDDQFTRDSFVVLLGREKIGKSMLLLEIAMRGLMEGCNVAFFQAGDMTAKQQKRRICMWLAQKSDKERYCGELHVPIVDCLNSQTMKCPKGQSSIGVLIEQDGSVLSHEKLMNAFTDCPDYIPCRNNVCKERRPTIWFRIRKEVEPLNVITSRRVVHKFRQRFPRQFKLATYSNETLTISEIRSLLDTWEQQENFIPDICLIDYIDILAPDSDTRREDHRHQEDKKFQRARRLSEERHCLVVTVTQADAASYKQELLGMENFSESKTKHAHVTAEFGLNQTEEEKKIGLMRINSIVVREGDFDRRKVVRILQRLQMGKPLLGSF